MHRILLIVLLGSLAAGCAAPAPPVLVESSPPVRTQAVTEAATIEVYATGLAIETLPTGHSGWGGEPSVVVRADGAIFTTAWDETLRSTDGGHEWKVMFNATRDVPVKGNAVSRSGDPWLALDVGGTRVYSLHAFLPCPALAWSDDAGDSWTRRDTACGSPYDDHPELASARPGPKTNPFATGATSILILCLNKGALQLAPGTPAATQVACRMSYDSGASWPIERALAAPTGEPDTVDCQIDHGAPVATSTGIILVPGSVDCSRPGIYESEDSGLTWVLVPGPEGPGVDPLATDPVVKVAPDQSVFLLWQGKDHQKWLARSADLGQTWAGPWRVSPENVTTTDFQTMSISPDGRVSIAFLGAKGPTGYAGLAPENVRFHLWVATSDGASIAPPTFRALQATPDDDPVQIGCTNAPPGSDAAQGSAGACSNLGDFLSSTIGPEGAFYVAFTDGCTIGCAHNSAATWKQSRGTETVIVKVATPLLG